MSLVYIRSRYAGIHVQVVAAVLLVVVLIGKTLVLSDKSVKVSPALYIPATLPVTAAVCAEGCAPVDSLTLLVTVDASDKSDIRLSPPVAGLNIRTAVAVSF